MTWAGLKDSLSDAVDAEYGEAVEFRPMAKLTVNDPLAPDTERSVIAITGVFSMPTQALNIDTRTFTTAAAANPTLTRPRVCVDLREFLPGELPRRGDHMVRSATGDVYLIEELVPDGQGRMLFPLQYVTTEEAL